MDTERRNEAMIELRVFLNKLKEMLQKTPVDLDNIEPTDRDVIALITVVNEDVLEYFKSDMEFNNLVRKLYIFFRQVDAKYNIR